MLRILFGLAFFGLLIGAWYFGGLFRKRLLVRRASRAAEEYRRDRARLELEFCRAASSTGKPRGLAWKSCTLHDQIRVARDRANRELVGLTGVTIRFEAIEGGGMEEVEAVGNLRAATAVFQWSPSGWRTEGRAIFNLEPDEVLERYAEQLDPVTCDALALAAEPVARS